MHAILNRLLLDLQRYDLGRYNMHSVLSVNKGVSMLKSERLRLEAKAAAEFRGHALTKFEHKIGNHKLFAECTICGKCVVVLPRPFLNESELSGEVLAVHCKGAA